jgi:hypothetical protein
MFPSMPPPHHRIPLEIPHFSALFDPSPLDILLGQQSEVLKSLPKDLAIVSGNLMHTQRVLCDNRRCLSRLFVRSERWMSSRAGKLQPPNPAPALLTTDSNASVEDRRDWVSAIQAAHASVSPDSAAHLAQSLARQSELFENLDTSSQARLAAMFIDLALPLKSPIPQLRTATAANVGSDPSPSPQSSSSDVNASSTAYNPDPHSVAHVRTKSDSLSSGGRITSPQEIPDEATHASAAVPAGDAHPASRSRSKTISPSLLSNPLFAKKSAVSVFNHFGRLASLMLYAQEQEPGGVEVLLAESQALEACVRKVPNFAHISPEQMLHTVQNAVRKTCDAGDLLLREGDMSGNMLYIHAGSVSVSSASKGHIANIYHDNIVGHHSYIYRRPRTATVHAAKENNTNLIYYEFMLADFDESVEVHKRRSLVSSVNTMPNAPSISAAPSSLTGVSSHSSSISAPKVYSSLPLVSPTTTTSAAASSSSFSPSFTTSNHSKRGSLPAMPSIDEG